MDALRRNWLRWLVYAGALVPLAVLLWDFSQDQLTANPIEAIQRRTGLYAIILFIATLAVTPLSRALRSRRLLELRRGLGLLTFLYVSLHFFNFLVIDYGLDFYLIREDLFEKRYAVAGFAAFLLLLPLAVTSTRGWMVRLGKNWRRLHMLVYPAAAMAAVHFLWQVKADFRLPLVYGVIIILLLILRLPVMKRLVGRLGRRPDEESEPGF